MGRLALAHRPIRERTIYYWAGTGFEPVAALQRRADQAGTHRWGAPTFEIDGIKMLPTAQVSPFEDAQRKVRLVAAARQGGARHLWRTGLFRALVPESKVQREVLSFEKNPDVIWLRSINPWSPRDDDPRLELQHGDIVERITTSRRAPSMRSCMTHRASALLASSIRRRSTTSWRA